MTDYNKGTNFGDKDTLDPNDPAKVVYGSEWDAEFDDITDAITSKYDSTDIASQAQAEAGADNTTLMTPLRTEQALAALMPARGMAAIDAGSTYAVATSDQASTDTENYTEHSELTVRMSQGKRFEFEIFIIGGGHTDSPNVSVSADIGVNFSSTPTFCTVVPYATGGAIETNLVLPAIADGTDGDWQFQIDANQSPSSGSFTYGPIRGLIRSSNIANTRMFVKWRLTDFIGGEGAAWINAGSYIRIRQLD